MCGVVIRYCYCNNCAILSRTCALVVSQSCFSLHFDRFNDERGGEFSIGQLVAFRHEAASCPLVGWLRFVKRPLIVPINKRFFRHDDVGSGKYKYSYKP